MERVGSPSARETAELPKPGKHKLMIIQPKLLIVVGISPAKAKACSTPLKVQVKELHHWILCLACFKARQKGDGLFEQKCSARIALW